MIARYSASYPYLTIAKHHGVPYAVVLDYASRIPSATLQRSQQWQIDAWEAWERQREGSKS